MWVSKILRGKKPGKNAENKIRTAIQYYQALTETCKELVESLKEFSRSELYWDKIKEISISCDCPSFVYDLSVEKNQNYIANGIVIHNCGRHGEAGIALAVCMGDREGKYARAMALLAEHRRQLSEGIRMMREKGVEERKNYCLFDAKNDIKDSLVGIIAGMMYGSGAISGEKPIIALARHDDGSIKVSGRATSELVRRGVNLGEVFGKVCSALGEGCEGGGHKIAAGCKIPSALKAEFLERLDTEIGKVYT